MVNRNHTPRKPHFPISGVEINVLQFQITRLTNFTTIKIILNLIYFQYTYYRNFYKLLFYLKLARIKHVRVFLEISSKLNVFSKTKL